MEEFPKNQENDVGENAAGADVLAQMPAFEEHMEEMGKKESVGEKYYQQAEAERDRWVEMSRKKLEEAENLKPETLSVIEDYRKFILSDRKEGCRPFDVNNEEDMLKFDEYKAGQIRSAEKLIHQDEQVNLDRLAECCKNEELIKEIGEKLKNDTDFTEEESEFLFTDDAQKCMDAGIFDVQSFMTPDMYYIQTHGIFGNPTYRELLKDDAPNTYWKIVAQAQMREISKQDRGLLHNDAEVQSSLENMEERRLENPFAGETNINSETGEMRTFTAEDNYPQLDGESDEDYAKRLRRIQLKTRMVEKQQ